MHTRANVASVGTDNTVLQGCIYSLSFLMEEMFYFRVLYS